MAGSARTFNEFIDIPVAHLVTEVLDCSWRPFVSAAHVDLFATNLEAAVVTWRELGDCLSGQVVER